MDIDKSIDKYKLKVEYILTESSIGGFPKIRGDMYKMRILKSKIK